MFDRYLTPTEFKKLKATLKAKADADAKRDLQWIVIMRYTGIRVGAMSKYTLADAHKAIETNRFVIRPEINKRESKIDIHLHREAKEALLALINMHPTGELFMPLVCSRLKKGMSKRSYELACKKWGKAAGICDFTPHWLRHTFAKELVRQSTSDDPRGVVQRLLGHKNANTTMIYTAPDKETCDLAVAALK